MAISFAKRFETARQSIIDWNEDQDWDAKCKWKSASASLIKGTAELLRADVGDLKFNPGGPAVSGDTSAIFSWGNGRLAKIHISADFPGYIRTVKDSNDYTGGINHEVILTEGMEAYVGCLSRFVASLP